jgi:hypothetical protein
MIERRRFPRIKKRYLVEFQAAGRICTGFTHNLSAAGLFVCSSYFPKPGTLLALRIKIPGGDCFTLRAEVVRSYKVPQQLSSFVPSGFCVQIHQAPEEYFQLLARLFHVAA